MANEESLELENTDTPKSKKKLLFLLVSVYSLHY